VVGKSKEASVRLSEVAVHNWARIDGTYSGQGVDLLAYPLDRFLNVVLVWALEHMGQEDAEKFLKTLDSPLGDEANPHAVPDDQFDDSYDQIKRQ